MKKLLLLFSTPLLLMVLACNDQKSTKNTNEEPVVQVSLPISESSRAVMTLVKEGVELFNNEGLKAFETFRTPGSRWRKGDAYIFVIDGKGNMLVHTDTSLEGKNTLELTDVGGKPIIRGLIQTANAAEKGQGAWYHYQWPTPGGLFPRWKSSFVMPVTSSSGEKFIIGSGIYTDRMEKEFVVDLVKAAAREIQSKGDSGFAILHDKTSPFLAKDAYVVVFSMDGVDLVNPAFPDLEGRNVMELKDVNGKLIVKEMFRVMNEQGSGWVEYMWPRPGQSTPTQKSTYVTRASHNGKDYLVSCGTYLADAPKAGKNPDAMSASALVSLVEEGAAVLAKKGEEAYPEFRKNGGQWYNDNTYFFVWSTDGIRKFHAANPEQEGQDVNSYTDAIGRPIGTMILETGNSSNGAGWVHYLHPEPGSFFPVWKSSYVKRVRFPSGKSYIVGCGIYNMDMDNTLIEDLVNRAALLVEKQGKAAFPALRDKKGQYVFMDTYLFIVSPDGTELFNASMPSLEGKNIIDVKDLQGKSLVREEISLAMKEGKGWLDGTWYKPGDDQPALKRTYVKKIKYDGKTCIIGSGYYPETE